MMLNYLRLPLTSLGRAWKSQNFSGFALSLEFGTSYLYHGHGWGFHSIVHNATYGLLYPAYYEAPEF